MKLSPKIRCYPLYYFHLGKLTGKQRSLVTKIRQKGVKILNSVFVPCYKGILSSQRLIGL